VIWRLNQGADRRIRAKHPWVFSNELSVSPKGINPGQAITLQDAKGNFLAHGYGNPHSLIAFRALSFDAREEGIVSSEGVISRVVKTWAQRQLIGYQRSFRLIYGEGDSLPGLIVDRYLVEQNGKRAQVLAVQILSYGMHVIVSNPESFFRQLIEDVFDQKISEFDWKNTAVVLRNDVSVRKLEGLTYDQASVIKAIEGFDLSNIDLVLDPPYAGGAKTDEILMRADLIEGQKTGFFLDQAYNIEVMCQQIRRQKHSFQSPVRILDLCCYVGQWSTKIAAVFKELGIETEVTIVDVSEKALEFAKINAERVGAKVIVKRMDVMHDLAGLPTRHWDIVIADPPAFIKAKKDIPTGRAGYLKLFTQAFKLTTSGGLTMCCSCSAHFKEEEMIETLSKAATRGEAWIRCLNKGGQAADHPVLMSFAEGFYLKGFLFQVI
jgi:23S rRNA (cytosine1962-C5)-methyltransferase